MSEVSRRAFLGSACCGAADAAGLVAATGLSAPAFAAPDSPKTTLTADQALELLKVGNRISLPIGAGVCPSIAGAGSRSRVVRRRSRCW